MSFNLSSSMRGGLQHSSSTNYGQRGGFDGGGQRSLAPVTRGGFGGRGGRSGSRLNSGEGDQRQEQSPRFESQTQQHRMQQPPQHQMLFDNAQECKGWKSMQSGDMMSRRDEMNHPRRESFQPQHVIEAEWETKQPQQQSTGWMNLPQAQRDERRSNFGQNAHAGGGPGSYGNRGGNQQQSVTRGGFGGRGGIGARMGSMRGEMTQRHEEPVQAERQIHSQEREATFKHPEKPSSVGVADAHEQQEQICNGGLEHQQSDGEVWKHVADETTTTVIMEEKLGFHQEIIENGWKQQLQSQGSIQSTKEENSLLAFAKSMRDLADKMIQAIEQGQQVLPPSYGSVRGQ